MVRGMRQTPFIGSEELASGRLSRHQLRAAYRAVFPNVYVPEYAELSLELRIRAAWLWSRRTAIIGGAAAAALHGAEWIPDNVPVELIHTNTHPPEGVLTRRETLCPGETQARHGLAVTTPERTAFDIGRRGAVRSAVVRLDALARATGFKVDDVLCVAAAHPRSPGLRRLEAALDLVDPGAQSPRESYLRLLLIDAGLPRPQTQIPVLCRRHTGRLPGLGLAGVAGGRRIRRRSPPHRPAAIHQRHSAHGDARGDGVGRHPGRGGGPPSRYHPPGAKGAGEIDCETSALSVSPWWGSSACRRPVFTPKAEVSHSKPGTARARTHEGAR